MQTSMVFSQRAWPGHDPRRGDGSQDLDDCWVVSAIQCVNVTAPWLRLVSVPAFRKAAKEPDVAGEANGGQLDDITRGVRRTWPQLGGRMTTVRSGLWSGLVRHANEHRPLSLAVISGLLPARMQFGFTGPTSFHQISLAVKGNGTWLIANPLAPVYSRWQKITPAELRPAVMAYGRAKGESGAWYVAFPTDAEMLGTYTGVDDPTPFDEEDVARLTAEIAAERDALAGRIDAARDALDG